MPTILSVDIFVGAGPLVCRGCSDNSFDVRFTADQSVQIVEVSHRAEREAPPPPTRN